MANLEFCAAVREISSRLFPAGFDTSPHPPNSFLDLALHVATTGRMCVTNAETADHEFDSHETWHHFRAWHDWCHLHGGHDFSLPGECAAVRMQHAMLAGLCGLDKQREWAPILTRQIIHDNFGDDAFCPAALSAN